MSPRSNRLVAWVFVAVWAVELAFGYYLCVVKDDIQNDALSRVANAFYVLYSRMPHLGAIGFVWNPLPSLLELTMVLLWPVFPAIVQTSLAGVVLSSLAAAGQAALLLKALRKHGVPVAWSLLLCLLLAAHPFVFLYGANGMSEMVFSFFLVWTLLSYLQWKREHTGSNLMMAGVGLALAFLTRYEAVAFGAALAAAVCIDGLRSRTPRVHRITDMPRRRYLRLLRQERRKYVVASLTVLLLPSLYAGLVWIAMNAIIMGDPLYFYHSQYSNLAQSSVLTSNSVFAQMVGHPWRVVQFMAQRVWLFSLPMGVVLLHRARRGRLVRWDTLIFLLLSLSIPALQFSLLLHGASYGWLRFFYYPLPVAAAWWVYELGLDAASGHRRRRRDVNLLMPVALIASAISVGMAMRNPTIAPEEYDTIYQKWNISRLQVTSEIATYINTRLPDATVLMDSFSAFNVIVHCRYPQHLIITSDYDFLDALRHPQAHHVQYILVPNPDTVFKFDAVNRQYPHLYAEGADWVTLEKRFDGWKLYAVKPEVPAHS
ncbi:glycosyltransferase family 39 protein [Alicyclobacillus macrosporangiidus]|uniref:Dolichyl-phosphate-mannose-protein mannosyltransferase n=1 Tax=Alicyclobacillus macrosporangiidus TaxID=392015 RepID=A0A1I7JH53_9BACL|nr:glycosyltransferase family 39 protein [Alicyclobacillus macrosporangiidus]SFU84496.1 Dolichyl-phosphate-mannose-protein mannosyltransferase [Alicyclobacillus macrosporangiidus]